jgi:hypothetical protein
MLFQNVNEKSELHDNSIYIFSSTPRSVAPSTVSQKTKTNLLVRKKALAAEAGLTQQTEKKKDDGFLPKRLIQEVSIAERACSSRGGDILMMGVGGNAFVWWWWV